MGFLKEAFKQQMKKQKEKYKFRRQVAQKNLEAERKSFAKESERQSKLRGKKIAKDKFNPPKKSKGQTPKMSLGDLF